MVEHCFLDLRTLSSDVPQGLVLDPLLFVVYINNLDVNLQGMVSKFADYIKVAGIVDSESSCQKVQQDLDQLARGQNNR